MRFVSIEDILNTSQQSPDYFRLLLCVRSLNQILVSVVATIAYHSVYEIC